MAPGVLGVVLRIVQKGGEDEIIEPSDNNLCSAPIMVGKSDFYHCQVLVEVVGLR